MIKSDFDMVVRRIPDGDAKVYPVIDVHLGAAEHMTEAFEKWVSWIAAQANAYVILGGDLINNGTRTSVTNVFEETMRPMTQKRRMAELLAPIRDRILCYVPGNHEARSGKDADDDPAYDIMAKLDLEDLYRPNLAILKLQLGKDDHAAYSRERPAYILAVHHGAGGGMLTGGAVNRAERFAYTFDGIDALIQGHTHKRFDTTPMKVRVDPHNERVTTSPYLVISSGSWLAYGGYALRKQLLPVASGQAGQSVITLSSKGKNITLTTSI